MVKNNSPDKKLANAVDCPMGAGKSSSAINYINSMPDDEHVIYVAPYNKEGLRIQEACERKKLVFLEQVNGTKLNDLRKCVVNNWNVVSTHALLARYTDDIIEKISAGNYTLIIDEAYEVTRTVTDKQRKVFFGMMDEGLIEVKEGGAVAFADKEKQRIAHLLDDEFAILVDSGAVVFEDDKIVIWVFPVKILDAFKRIIVMTFMLDAQPMYYYLKYNGYDLNYIGTRTSGYGKFEFCDIEDSDGFRYNPRDKIEIVTKEKLNRIGDEKSALSSSWYKREKSGGSGIDVLRKNIQNVAKNVFEAKSGELIWTTFNGYMELLSNKNIKRAFVVCNARATNDWKEATKLIYAVNMFVHPDSYNFFKRKGFVMDMEKWALSNMVQWIWRSAIRDGKEVQLYIPSERMRNVLIKWLNTFKEE